MNLNKVIELNNESELSLRKHKFMDHADAIKISNEAVKVLQHGRHIGAHHDPTILPGETQD